MEKQKPTSLKRLDSLTSTPIEQTIDKATIDKINYINEVKVFNEIQNSQDIVIFDFRTELEYKQAYIPEYSINIPYDKTSLTSLSDHNTEIWSSYTSSESLKQRLKRLKRQYIIIILSAKKIKRNTIQSIYRLKAVSINPEKQDERKAYTGLLFYQTLLRAKIREIGLLNRGFLNFELNYGFLLKSTSLPPRVSNISHFPSEIINGRIYIGNQQQATNPDVIKYMKITHIVNVTQHVRNAFEEKGIKYLNIRVDDTPDYKISKHFKQAYEYIESAFAEVQVNGNWKRSYSFTDIKSVFDLDEKEDLILKERIQSEDSMYVRNKRLQVYFSEVVEEIRNSNRVLIHCSLGVSRSPAITCMYLMKKLCLSVDEVMSIIKFNRESACPISSFVDELEQFEKKGFCFD